MNKPIIDLEKAPVAKHVDCYGGNAGAKASVIIDDNVWMVKYPKSTKDYDKPQRSYTTSPLSEYIGSKIYEILGMPVHEVLLGIRKNKVVVACKNFTQAVESTFITKEFASKYKIDESKVETSVPIVFTNKKLIHFHCIKNHFMSSDLEKYSGRGSETLLHEILDTIQDDENLKAIDGVLERFWDMFVVDAFIGNNDRNNKNWGFLLDSNDILNNNSTMELAPVYDNGNAFFNKKSLKQMEERIADKDLLMQDAKGAPSVFKDSGDKGHRIHPFKFIKTGENTDCTNAVHRFLNRIDMDQVESLIGNIPESTGNLAVMPNIQKEFYLELLKLRLEQFKLSV